MTNLVHPILTEQQALLVHQALLTYLNSEDSNDVKDETSELVFFFNAVVENPGAFQLRSNADNKRVIRAARGPKGPAQPPRSKRKRRQLRSQGGQKRTRSDKKYEAEQYNNARQKMEAEYWEAMEDQQREVEQMVARFESIARKDHLTTDEFQEVLEMFGAPGPALDRIKELVAAEDPQARIDAAVAAAPGEGARSAVDKYADVLEGFDEPDPNAWTPED